MKKILLVLILTLGIAGTLFYQNCAGTRTRTSSFTASLSDVTTQLAAFQSQAQGNALTQIQAFQSLLSSPTSTLYYGLAPSSMGSVAQVFPINFAQLDSTVSMGSPSTFMAFVVVDQNADGSWVGAFLLTGNSGGAAAPAPTISGAAPTATPLASATPLVSATPVGTAAPVATSAPQFGFSYFGLNLSENSEASSLGIQAVDGGQFINGILVIPLVVDMQSSQPFSLSTDDVNADQTDLTGPLVQFRILSTDGNGNDVVVGILNVVEAQ